MLKYMVTSPNTLFEQQSVNRRIRVHIFIQCKTNIIFVAVKLAFKLLDSERNDECIDSTIMFFLCVCVCTR